MKKAMLMLTPSMTMLPLSAWLLNNKTMIILDYTIINNTSTQINMSMLWDWTATLFMMTVLFITGMIIIYSNYYIPQQEITRFLLLMMMFVLAMILLISSNNLITILVGWDGLGFTSYILVAYYQNHSSSSASSMTILSNRIGDIMMMITISIQLSLSMNFNMNMMYPKMSMIMISIAAMTKSAQYPFSAWLPAAMAAPTPISALVHSSTLVTAGVYILMRTNNWHHPTTMFILMMTSSYTTITAGISANWEQDMKKIIALSTLSQISMMMFAISINAYKMALTHLIIHALFKSTMFMAAGIMINTHSYQDMRPYNPSLTSPIAATALGVSNLALMGLPFMTSFYTKDLILEKMLSNNNNMLMSLMITSVGLTAVYSTRMSYITMKPLLKNKPDSTISKPKMNMSLMMMIPSCIFTGTILSWMYMPEQMMMLSITKKLSILLMITLGITMGISLTFKKKMFLKTNEFFISLWFNHFVSTHPLTHMNKLTKMTHMNDNTWLEMWGPQGAKKSLTSMSKKTNLLSITMLMLMMLTLIPITMMT